MSVTLKLRQALKVDDCVRIGDENVDTTLTGLTNDAAYGIEDTIVADNFGTAILWTTGQGGITTFEKAYIFSDRDIVVELRTDKGSPEFIILFIRANELTPLPAKAGGNTTESLDGSILVDGTDFDDVDRIEVQRDVAEGVGDASVSLFLFN